MYALILWIAKSFSEIDLQSGDEVTKFHNSPNCGMQILKLRI